MGQEPTSTGTPPAIAFMLPPGGDQRSFGHHLGVAYVQAHLKTHGVPSCQVVPVAGLTPRECATQLVGTGAGVIGFTCFDNNFYLVRLLAALVKAQEPDTTVIAGGPTATFSDELLLNHCLDVDLCVRYEGEETTLELLQALSNGSCIDELDGIRGVTFRRSGELVRTPDRDPLCSDAPVDGALDSLPSPYLEGILTGIEGAGVLSSRGCVHRCTYCNFSAMSRYRLRYHSVDRVVAELSTIDAALQSPKGSSSPPIVAFQDDALTLNAPRAKEICRRIAAEGLHLRFSGLCRADNLDEELVGLLDDAGFVEITFGLESAVPRVLRDIKKVRAAPAGTQDDCGPERRFLRRVTEGVSAAKRRGMRTSVSIILGLPGESLEDGLATARFVDDLGVDFYSHNFLMVFPGTEVFSSADDWGIGMEMSESVLPYYTRWAYDVSQVPIGSNSSLWHQARIEARSVLRAFAGGLGPQQVGGDGVCQAIVQLSDLSDARPHLEWLASRMAVNGRVVIVDRQQGEPADFRTLTEMGAEAGLPTRSYSYLTTDRSADGAPAYGLLDYGAVRLGVRFPVRRLTDIAARAGIGVEGAPDRSWPVYALDDETDALLLGGLAQTLEADPPARRACIDGVVLDGCRWCAAPCPAIEMRRAVITSDGEVRPCVSGSALGTIADGLPELRRRASELYAAATARRGCASCPAVTRCSKCLFPTPLGEADYCALQREHPSLPRFVLRSKIANAVNPLLDDGL